MGHVDELFRVDPVLCELLGVQVAFKVCRVLAGRFVRPPLLSADHFRGTDNGLCASLSFRGAVTTDELTSAIIQSVNPLAMVPAKPICTHGKSDREDKAKRGYTQTQPAPGKDVPQRSRCVLLWCSR